jgi:hypothetical protein
MAETAAAREYVLDTHEELLETILVCADGVAKSWDSGATTERRAVVVPFESALDGSGVTDRLPTVLVGAVHALGEELPADPVPAPPYVAITSLGPVLRATLDSGRLVITIYAFDIERGPTRYVRRPADPTDALTVELKTR